MPIPKSIIFFPAEAGLAHITRSLAIAEELVKRRHNVLFALPVSKQWIAQKSRVNIVPVTIFAPDDKTNFETLKDPSTLLPFIKEEIKLLRKYKPDMAIIDYRISAVVACAMCSIPAIFVSNTDGLPCEMYIPNPHLPRFIFRLLVPLFQKLGLIFKWQYLEGLAKAADLLGSPLRVEKLVETMEYIIPEVQNYLPLNDKTLKRHYIGPISWQGFSSTIPDWFNRIKPDGRTIYLTFGGTGYDGKKLVQLATTLVNQGYRVIVSSSTIIAEDKFPKLKNLFVAKFLPGKDMSKQVDVVVCHGGIGTMTESILSGTPVVAVPFNPDQYYHALRFEELGLGVCVTAINVSTVFSMNWSHFEEVGKRTPVKNIVEAAGRVFSHKDFYTKSIEKFSANFPKTSGSENAATIIEQLLSTKNKKNL